MSGKTNYSYVGIALIILVFGIIFIPKIINRIQNDDINRHESRTKNVSIKNPANHLVHHIVNGKKKQVPRFQFLNQNNILISNKDYLGKVYLVEFFFTTCPTICPKMNKNLVHIQNKFKNMDNFGIASFTINPEYDTPEILKQYANNYGVTNPNWHFLTGTEEAIYDLANNGFYIPAIKDKEAEGGFEHSGKFALIDKKGFLRSRIDAHGNPKIYYSGIVSQEEGIDEDGEQEEISMLIEDINTLLLEDE